MIQRVYVKATSLIFLLIAILHLLRLIFAWEAVLGGWVVPQWLSVGALIIAGYLAYEGLRLSKG